MTNFRKIASLAALSLTLVVGSGVAMAEGNGEHKAPSYPIAGAEFQQHVAARTEKHRARMEAMITEKNIPADKAAEMRAHFAERTAKVNAEVARAIADGTVTKEEAQAVRQAAGGGHECSGKGKDKTT